MKKNRYSEEQILGILGKVEKRKAIAEVCRIYGVSEATVTLFRFHILCSDANLTPFSIIE